MTCKSRKVDLNEAVRRFEEEHKVPGSGIVSVRAHGNSIMVVVESEEAAKKIQRSFDGINVARFLDLGRGQVRLFIG